VVVREQDNGHAIQVRVGEQVEVLLTGSWQLDGSDNQAVMRQDGQTAVSTQGSGCIPAQGCGTVMATYDAIAAGRADLDATRTSCDEQMSCAGNPGIYRVTVVVAG
jgi:hypothetical protein